VEIGRDCVRGVGSSVGCLESPEGPVAGVEDDDGERADVPCLAVAGCCYTPPVGSVLRLGVDGHCRWDGAVDLEELYWREAHVDLGVGVGEVVFGVRVAMAHRLAER